MIVKHSPVPNITTGLLKAVTNSLKAMPWHTLKTVGLALALGLVIVIATGLLYLARKMRKPLNRR